MAKVSFKGMSPLSESANGLGLQSERAPEALSRYAELKREIAAIAQAGLQICRELKDEEREKLYRSLLGRIAEDRFNLAVLGHFNRGKSSLMNAILGMDRLPTAVLPHTSVVTTVTYGSRERILIHCAGWSFPQEVPLERLAEFVTERRNPGNRQQVTLAEIQLPSEILRRGFHFIDTPGVGSGIRANTTATERFIPEIDAAIFVSSFEAPIGEDELEFLQRVHREIRKVFIVLNKLDLVPEKERSEVVRFVNSRLDSALGLRNHPVFSLSAKRALDAKLLGDADALDRWGLPRLEQALSSFLSAEKTVQFCSRTLDRLVELLKRQQAELAISLATRDDDGSLEKLRDQFKCEISNLAADASGRAALLHAKLSAGITKELDAPLDSFFRDLADRVSPKFLADLTARRVLFHGAQSERLLREAATFCEQSISEWLTAAAPVTIRLAIEKIGGETLRNLSQLPEVVLELASELIGLASDASGNAATLDDAHSIDCELVLPRLSHTAWKRLPPLWLCLVPLHWMDSAVASWFTEVSDAALAEYRRQLEALIRAAAEDYIDTLAREVVRKITERGERIAGYIGSEQQSSKASIIEDLLQRASSLRQQLNGLGSGAGYAGETGAAPLAIEASAEADTALSEEPCPICERTSAALFAFLIRHQYAISTSEIAQTAHAASGGFCAPHTWMYSEVTSQQAICRAYPALLASLSERVLKGVVSGSRVGDLEVLLRRILRHDEDCPACTVVARIERAVAAGIIRRHSEAQAAQLELPILCLAHLHTTLATEPPDDLARALAQRTAMGLERSGENMRRYSLKHDAIRRDLVSHEERIAYLLGLARVARDKRLAPRWVRDER